MKIKIVVDKQAQKYLGMLSEEVGRQLKALIQIPTLDPIPEPVPEVGEPAPDDNRMRVIRDARVIREGVELHRAGWLPCDPMEWPGDQILWTSPDDHDLVLTHSNAYRRMAASASLK